MSNDTASGKPAAAATRRRGRARPRPGPLSSSATGSSAATDDRHQTAGRRHHQHRRRPAPRCAGGTAGTSGAAIAFGDRRDGPLVLPELRRHLVRARDVEARGPRARRATASSCAGFEVGVQQAHRDRVDAGGDRREPRRVDGDRSRRRARRAVRRPRSRSARAARAARADRRTGRRATAGPGVRSRSRRRSPRVVTSATRPPCRSSSAFVATVDPCASSAGRPPPSSSMPACTAASGSRGRRRRLHDPAVVGDDVGERALRCPRRPASASACQMRAPSGQRGRRSVRSRRRLLRRCARARPARRR